MIDRIVEITCDGCGEKFRFDENLTHEKCRQIAAKYRWIHTNSKDYCDDCALEIQEDK